MSVTESKAVSTTRKAAKNPKNSAQSAAVEQALANTPVEMVPLSQLALSPLNVRKVSPDPVKLQELADSIRAVGVLQNLIVHLLPDGLLGAAAGGRRFRALNILLNGGMITTDYAVPVKTVSEEMAKVVSATENFQHEEMHPADQIAVFGEMSREGKTAAQIAGVLGYSTKHVQKFLRLAGMAPALLTALAEDKLNVDQLQALSASEDQERQLNVWENAFGYYRNPKELREAVLKGEVPAAGNRLLDFVGREAYEQAGGGFRYDLFSDEGFIGDTVLLHTVARQKLTDIAASIAQAEGWLWSEGGTEGVSTYGEDAERYLLLKQPAGELTPEERARFDALGKQLETLSEQDDDEDAAVSRTADKHPITPAPVKSEVSDPALPRAVTADSAAVPPVSPAVAKAPAVAVKQVVPSARLSALEMLAQKRRKPAPTADRYRALAERYADLSSPDTPVTAVVTGAREQQHLTGIIRDALQNAGKLERDGVTVEARTPVYASVKERLLPATYRAGMVLEDRSDKNETRHYTLDRVHEETRMLSLIDSDGVLSRVKLSDLTGDWRLFTREQLHVAQGEQLFALAADKANGLKARDRLTVTAVSEGKLTVQRHGQKKPLQVATDRPLYLTHGYVSAPGSRDNEHGIVLASLNARDLSGNIMNALAQSGHEAEIFTGEAQNKAEEKLGRMRTTRSPLALVRQVSGKEDAGEALAALNAGLLTDAQKAVSRAVAQMKDVAFSEVKLLEQAGTFFNNLGALRGEVTRQVKEGDLIPVKVAGGGGFVGRATWEMEKAIIREIDTGKNTQTPLMATMDPVLLNGLTAGQKAATTLILQSPDRFTAVQGYAGVGKTTQFRAVKAAIDTLPESERPLVIGLAPTHRAVKEMRDVGIEALPVLPGEKQPDYAALIRQASGLLAQNEALQGNNGGVQAVLASLAGSGQFASTALPVENAQGSLVSAEALRYVQAEQDKAHGSAKNPQNDLSERALASAARELEKQGQLTLPPESRGREPEREEITHEAVRNIQKER